MSDFTDMVGDMAEQALYDSLLYDYIDDDAQEAMRRAEKQGKEYRGDPSEFIDDGERFIDNDDVDSTSRAAVMRAYRDRDYWGDVEELLEDALDDDVRFTPEDIIELSWDIHDRNLLKRLIASSSDFTYMQRCRLAPHWGGANYDPDLFDGEDE